MQQHGASRALMGQMQMALAVVSQPVLRANRETDSLAAAVLKMADLVKMALCQTARAV